MGIISLLNGGCFNILKNPKADPKTEFHNFPNFPLANKLIIYRSNVPKTYMVRWFKESISGKLPKEPPGSSQRSREPPSEGAGGTAGACSIHLL